MLAVARFGALVWVRRRTFPVLGADEALLPNRRADAAILLAMDSDRTTLFVGYGLRLARCIPMKRKAVWSMAGDGTFLQTSDTPEAR